MASILIAEDDPLVSSFLERGLRARGWATVVAADGEEAERLSLTGQFDLLILDMGLPGRGGFAVLQRLRSRGERLPVLVLTGQPELRDAVASLEAGADDFMTKPFRFGELTARAPAAGHGDHGAESRQHSDRVRPHQRGASAPMNARDRRALAVLLVVEPDPVHERPGHAAMLIVTESDDVTDLGYRVKEGGAIDYRNYALAANAE